MIMKVTRPKAIAAVLLTILMGCAEEQATDLRCPTPAGDRPIVAEELPKKTDRELLAQREYYYTMMNHGSNQDLRALIGRAESADNYPFADKGMLKKVRASLEFREKNKCPDVPSYDPQSHYIVRPMMGNMLNGRK